jgi:hypothetical protein
MSHGNGTVVDVVVIDVIAEHRMVAPPRLSHHGSRAMRLFHQNDNDNNNGSTLVQILEVTKKVDRKAFHAIHRCIVIDENGVKHGEIVFKNERWRNKDHERVVYLLLRMLSFLCSSNLQHIAR